MMPSAPEDEMQHRSEIVIRLKVDAGEALQLRAQTGLFAKLPQCGLVGSLTLLRQTARQLPVQMAVGVVHQEHATPVVEDGARSTERGPRNREILTHRRHSLPCGLWRTTGTMRSVTAPVLDLTRAQILAYRRTVQALDKRLPPGLASLRRAAWAGLQDSMPRAALLSIHARVEGTEPSTWEHPSLVQLWGPRFSAYVVAARDRALFSLGRLPAGGKSLQVAHEMASRLHAFLDGRTMTYGEAGDGLRVHPNRLRYAAPTGTVLIRWDGAHQPTIWTTPAPEVDPREARLELARRYVHIFGPTTAAAFARWAGIGPREGQPAFDALGKALSRVRTPVGDGCILTSDEPMLRARTSPSAVARLLPSGDTYFLLQGEDRELLVPDPARRSLLWTSRVWPGAVLFGGEVIGTWRRAERDINIQPWRRLTRKERDALAAEAESLPLPGLQGMIRLHFDD